MSVQRRNIVVKIIDADEQDIGLGFPWGPNPNQGKQTCKPISHAESPTTESGSHAPIGQANKLTSLEGGFMSEDTGESDVSRLNRIGIALPFPTD